MALTDFHRRSDAIAHLVAIGITGAASDALLHETGATRHAWRVGAATMAALDYMVGRRSGDGECVSQVECVAILLADYYGIGGRDGVEGGATDRHPGLDALGKGRKQASDGPAWSAAIRAAAQQAMDGLSYVDGTRGGWAWCVGDDGSLGLECRAGDALLHSCSVAGFDGAAVAPRWALTIAREGLRRTAGLAPWFGGYDRRDCWWLPAFCGGAAEWAALVNTLTDAVSDETAAVGDLAARSSSATTP